MEPARGTARGSDRGRDRYDRYDRRGGSRYDRRSKNSSRYGPPLRTEFRIIVENLSSRVSWQVRFKEHVFIYYLTHTLKHTFLLANLLVVHFSLVFIIFCFNFSINMSHNHHLNILIDQNKVTTLFTTASRIS